MKLKNLKLEDEDYSDYTNSPNKYSENRKITDESFQIGSIRNISELNVEQNLNSNIY